jgi:hypothetical protein
VTIRKFLQIVQHDWGQKKSFGASRQSAVKPSRKTNSMARSKSGEKVGKYWERSLLRISDKVCVLRGAIHVRAVVGLIKIRSWVHD